MCFSRYIRTIASASRLILNKKQMWKSNASDEKNSDITA